MTDKNAQAAFTGWVSELAREHTHALARVARDEGLTAEYALDAVQEGFATLLRMPEARSLVGNPGDSRALLVVVVRNVARNLRRRHHQAKPHALVEDDVVLETDLPSVDELVMRAEEHIQLQGCVGRLDEVQRRVVTLRMLEEASGAEVAELLSLSPGHVAVLLHRAKQDLLRCMKM